MVYDKCKHLIQLPELQGNLLQAEESCYNLWSLCKYTQRLGEGIAEFGVYRGASARLLCDVKGERQFHLFDTFNGLPKTMPEIDTEHRQGDFGDTSEIAVKKLLAKETGVHFHKGFFPDSASELEHLRFSFVHLDVDIYQSTMEGLKWFYPRLVQGGVLISHDYFWHGTLGVTQAFQDFFGGMNVPVIRLHEVQALVIKP
jgi:predicted O-methyltransferase YrrM